MADIEDKLTEIIDNINDIIEMIDVPKDEKLLSQYVNFVGDIFSCISNQTYLLVHIAKKFESIFSKRYEDIVIDDAAPDFIKNDLSFQISLLTTEIQKMKDAEEERYKESCSVVKNLHELIDYIRSNEKFGSQYVDKIKDIFALSERGDERV